MSKPEEKERFRISQFSFKPDEALAIEKTLSSVVAMFEKLNMPTYFEDKISKLASASLKDLLEISTTWEKLTFELEATHFKCAVTREYKYINDLIDDAKKYVATISDIVEKLENELKTDYTQIINSNDFFGNYFSYKEFRNTFLVQTSPESITLEKALILKNENMFATIRRKIISDKANIHYLLTDSDKKIIHINDIKKQDYKTFDLIRTEFFVTLCEETMGIKVPYGKKSKTEIIRPSHVSADKLRLQKTELVYFTVSLEPIEDSTLAVDDVIEFHNGLKFEITVPQQMIQREMFYQLKLDKLSTCNLLVPVYFSYIRCNLVKEQRTNHTKINDKKFLEELSEVVLNKATQSV